MKKNLVLLLTICLTACQPTHQNKAIEEAPTEAINKKCDSNELLPLVEAILTPDEMINEYPIFESENRWTESTDLTEELVEKNICSLDCAKQLWSPVTVSIVLIESPTLATAQELVNETRKSFDNVLEVTDRPYISDLAQNTWIAYDYTNHEFVLLYSYGSVFIHIVNHPVTGFDDFAGEFDLIYALGRMQKKYLCSSGYNSEN